MEKSRDTLGIAASNNEFNKNFLPSHSESSSQPRFPAKKSVKSEVKRQEGREGAERREVEGGGGYVA